MYMRIFNTSSRLGQYHSLTQVLTQYQYQFQYQKCSIPIPKISSIEFPDHNFKKKSWRKIKFSVHFAEKFLLISRQEILLELRFD